MFTQVCAERCSIPTDEVDRFQNSLVDILASFERKDIFNADETALYYRALPGRTLEFNYDGATGVKVPKERITVLVGGSALGEELPFMVIGKFQSPRYFHGIRKRIYHVHTMPQRKAGWLPIYSLTGCTLSIEQWSTSAETSCCLLITLRHIGILALSVIYALSSSLRIQLRWPNQWTKESFGHWSVNIGRACWNSYFHHMIKRQHRAVSKNFISYKLCDSSNELGVESIRTPSLTALWKPSFSRNQNCRTV